MNIWRARNDFDRWKNSAHAVLKTLDDWIAFEAWRPTRRRKTYASQDAFRERRGDGVGEGPWQASPSEKARAGARADDLAPTKAEVAKLLTAMGVPGVTTDVLKRAARYEADPIWNSLDPAPGR